MKLIVKDSTITMVEGGTLIQNDKTPCNVEFVFTGNWNDYPEKNISFKAGKADEVPAILIDGKCLIPEACLTEGGVLLKVCVKAKNGDQSLYTVWTTLGRILYDASLDAGGGGGFIPEGYDELKKDIGDMTKLQTESKDLVGAVNELKNTIDHGGTCGHEMATDNEIDSMLDDVFESVKE